MMRKQQHNLITVLMSRIKLVFLFVFFSTVVSAQHFKNEAKLPKVDSTGFYRIVLPPVITAKINDDARDLRITDDSKEIPYLLKLPQTGFSERKFHDYEMVSKEYFKDSLTQIIIKVISGKPINQLVLVARSADLWKNISITGSDDQKQWFGVKNNHLVYPEGDNERGITILQVDFPVVNYKYYKLVIDDRNSLPLNIERVGYFLDSLKTFEHYELKADSVFTKSMSGETTVSLKFKEQQVFDFFSFDVTNAELYKRKMFLAVWRWEKPGIRIAYELFSGKKNQLQYYCKTSQVDFIISDGDSPPLDLNVKCYQYKRYAVVKLEKDKDYVLRFGDSLIKKPSYDLEYFQSAIPEILPVLTPEDVKEIAVTPVVGNPESFFSSKKILWGVIIIVVGFLGFVTRRMIKNM